MAVGTTRPDIAKTWTQISDQLTVHLRHESGPDFQLALKATAPAASEVGMTIKAGDFRTFRFAASEYLWAKTDVAEGNPSIVTVLQSART